MYDGERQPQGCLFLFCLRRTHVSSDGIAVQGALFCIGQALIVHSTTRAPTLPSCIGEKPLKAELCGNNLLKCASRSSIVRPKHSDDIAVYAPVVVGRL